MKILGYDQLLYFFKGLKTLFVAKEDGKGLSTNDYTTAEKNKLAGIAEGANKTIVDSALSDSSTNPVQNKIVKGELDKKAVKTDVDTALAGKADASHTHEQSEINGLSTALAGKANASHTHAQSDITGLADALAGKADAEHGIHVISGGSAGQVLKKTSTGYAWSADNDTVYTHPDSHPATMITEDASHRFVTDTEKSTWNSKANGTHTHVISDVTNLQTKLDAKVETSKLGQANGVATLDSTGKVPSSQLPSYVDDVLEGYLYNGKFYKESAHTTEITGEGGKIYVDLSTNYSYRWSGTTYVKIESVDITLITNSEIDTILAS